ncbi:MAG: cyclase family protein [Candidatus Thermoplasmatota archaeon]
MPLLDVSQPVTNRTAAWPGDEPFSCGWTVTKAQGGSVNVGWTRSSPHMGTHVDAPFHYDDAGARVGELDVEAFVGPCIVIDAVGRAALDEALLANVRLPPRVLFRTEARNDPEVIRREFPTLTRGAVALLRDAGVRLVGVDAPSVDSFDSETLEVHHALHRAGIVNVENLALAGAPAGHYELLAAPVRWMDMDAAPVRALLRT